MMIKSMLVRLDNFLERKWRETSAVLFYLADKKVNEEDIDWINMHNNMIEDKKENE